MNASTYPGYATPEGTYKFKHRFEGKGDIAQAHFKKTTTGHWLSSIGMGTYLGDTSLTTDGFMREAAIRSISSGGMNVLDTASNYRYQMSERALGNAIQALINEGGVKREEFFVCTKGGFLTPDAAINKEFQLYFRETFMETGVVRPEDVVANMHCMTPTFLNHQLNQSLKNLKLETLDLLYLHNAVESQMSAIGEQVFMERLEEVFRFYEMSRTKQKIRYYGIASWDCFRVKPTEPHYINLAALVQMAHKVGGDDHGFRFIQLPYNVQMNEALYLKNQEIGGREMTILEAAQHLGIGVFTSVPLLQARLLSQETMIPKFPLLTSTAQRCLQFVRSTPGVIAPLVGHKKPEHVEDNLGLAQIPPLTPTYFEAKYTDGVLRHT